MIYIKPDTYTNSVITKVNNVFMLGSDNDVDDFANIMLNPNLLDTIFGSDIVNVVTSIMYIPINESFVPKTSLGTLDFKNVTDAGVVSGYGVYANNFKVHIGSFIMPDIEETDFTDYEPYTDYIMYLPFVGEFSLPCIDIYGHSLYIDLKIDLTNGEGIYYIYLALSGADYKQVVEEEQYSLIERLYITKKCQLGYQIPLSSTGEWQRIRNISLGVINTSVNLASFGVSMALPSVSNIVSNEEETTSHRYISPKTNRMRTYNKNITETSKQSKRVSRNVGSGVSSVLDSTNSMLSTFSISPSYSISPNTYAMMDMATSVLLIKRKVDIADIDDNYKHLNGLPLGETRQLETLRGSGYTEISNVHIAGQGFSKATNEELNMLQELLTSGIIL